MKTVLICRNDSNEQQLADALANDPEIELTTITQSDGLLDSLAGLQPDMLITDLILQGIDGMQLIDYVAANLPQTKSVVISEISDAAIISNAIARGAAYYFIKPLNLDGICRRLKDIYNTNKTTPRIDEVITNVFLAIGIPPHIKGYPFLREAIKLVVENRNVINGVTKGIYPLVARQHATTASKVERSIRHAIEIGWSRGRHEAIASVFGSRAYINDDKPTNSEFIALVAEYIWLRLF